MAKKIFIDDQRVKKVRHNGGWVYLGAIKKSCIARIKPVEGRVKKWDEIPLSRCTHGPHDLQELMDKGRIRRRPAKVARA